MHLKISSIAGSVSGNVITIGSKEGPECLKADVFQITSFGLIKTLLLPTDFSFVLHMNTRYSNPQRNLNLARWSVSQQDFFYNSYDLTHQSL